MYKGTLTIASMGYHLQATSNKRAPIYNLDNRMVGTKPYFYDEIEVKSDKTEDWFGLLTKPHHSHITK